MPEDRLAITDDGSIRLELERPAADGTTAAIFDPVSFLARVAALIPPPKVHQTRHFGVLAPASSWRRHVVPKAPRRRHRKSLVPEHAHGPRLTWRDRLWRAQRIEGARCPRCAATMQLVAVVRTPTAVDAILAAIGIPDAPGRYERLHPARGPPRPA